MEKSRLFLRRKAGQSIVIGETTITLDEISRQEGALVRIEAPRSLPIRRGEETATHDRR